MMTKTRAKVARLCDISSPVNQQAQKLKSPDTLGERDPITSKHMLFAWVYHEGGEESLRQLLEHAVESSTTRHGTTRQSLEACAAEHRARNMVQLAEIVEQYAARCPDLWDVRFCPEWYHGDVEGWQRDVKRRGYR